MHTGHRLVGLNETVEDWQELETYASGPCWGEDVVTDVRLANYQRPGHDQEGKPVGHGSH